jgi:transposase
VRTYAPRGQTPVLRWRVTRHHLSAIAGLTLGGKLYLGLQEEAYAGPAGVRFLNHLLHHLPGKLIVIWDGASIHHGQAVRVFLATELGKRVHLERLPGYAPDLNAAEGIWHALKQVELRNVAFAGLGHLWTGVTMAAARLRHKRHVLLGCIKQVGYVDV